MVLKCYVLTCHTRYQAAGRGLQENQVPSISFHRIPNNPERQEKWLQNLRTVNGDAWVHSYSGSLVCSVHFDPSCWEKIRVDGSKKLRSTAFPSLFEMSSAIYPNEHGYSLASRRRRPLKGLDKNLTNGLPSLSACHSASNILNYKNNSLIGPLRVDTSDAVPTTVVADEMSSVHSTLNVVIESSAPATEPISTHLSSIASHLSSIASSTSAIDLLADCAVVYAQFSHEGVHPITSIPTDNTTNQEIQQDQIAGHFEAPPPALPEGPSSFSAVNVNCPVTQDQSSMETRESSPFKNITNCISVLQHEKISLTKKERDLERMNESLQHANKQLQEQLHKLQKEKDKVNLQNNYLVQTNRRLHKDKENISKQLEKFEENLASSFNPDQIKALSRKNTQGMKWGCATLKEGLILKDQCGTSGYESVRKLFPLPSVRTLQRETEHIKFEPGILEEVFDLLALQVPKKSEEWRDCALSFDEMAIEPFECVNTSTKCGMGQATLQSHGGYANKALVFALGGITTRWKEPVAYEFTRSKADGGEQISTGEALESIIHQIIEKAEAIGLKVHSVTSDMGADNRAYWRLIGIGASRSSVTYSITHPIRPDAKLCVLPDVPHLFKAIKSMLSSNEVFHLPSDLVEEESLSSNIVDVSHIKDLLENEEPLELKVAKSLKSQALQNNEHFGKMRMASPRSVFNGRVSTGLTLLGILKDDSSYATTAWFVKFINRWFELCTSRCHSVALSKHNQEAYEVALNHLSKAIRLFRDMRIGAKGSWKPSQTGVLIATSAILHLQDYFLNKRGFKFLFTARFTQDFIENIFSCIRFRHPTPDGAQFRALLKTLTIAQFCKAGRNSSYDHDDGEMVLDFLTASKSCAAVRQESNDKNLDLSSITVPHLTDSDKEKMSGWELMVLYDMAGSVLRSVTKTCRVCDKCVDALLWKGEEAHPYGIIPIMNDYKAGALYRVSEETFSVMWKSELTFRLVRDEVLKMKCNVHQFFVDSLSYAWGDAEIPKCHDIATKFIRRLFAMRLKIFGQKRRVELKATKGMPHSSKSVAMHTLVL